MTSKVSFIALSFCYALMLYTAFCFYPRWKQTKTEATISWDVSGYYMYLPALFIYKDIKHCSFKDSILTTYAPTPDFQQAFLHQASGNYVMKYSSGQAIMMLPYFLIAHSYCLLNSSFPADGFSAPYQMAIGIGMLLYAFLGLFVLRKVLLTFFKDCTVALLLLCYVVGSNYLNYSSIDQAMTHNVLFTIYSFILYCTIRFHKNPNFYLAIVLGILVGLATLIRPTDILSILIPLCWNIRSLKNLRGPFGFIQEHVLKYLLMLLFVFLIFFIQMLYWKYVAHEWFVYSYEKQGFSWFKPHVYNYTMSYACGWLRYSPMMILPILGIIYYLIKGQHAVAIVFFILINAYIVMAWDIWDYGGTAGRAMVQSYPIMAFPFCLLIEYLQKIKWTSILLYLTMLLFAYLNIWWTYHAHAGNIQVSGITKEYFWKVVGTWNGTDEDKKLLDNPHVFYGIPKHKTLLYTNHFEKDTSLNTFSDGANKLIRINKELQSSASYNIPYNPTVKKWIRATATFHCIIKEWNTWKQAHFRIVFFEHEKEIQNNFIKIHRLINNGETQNIYIDAKAPASHWTRMSISFFHIDGEQELWVDDLKVESFVD
ncbi:MAG: hypothetical protein R2831_08220 [Chitinophagaceae bacterium]